VYHLIERHSPSRPPYVLSPSVSSSGYLLMWELFIEFLLSLLYNTPPATLLLSRDRSPGLGSLHLHLLNHSAGIWKPPLLIQISI
jgi:hypothetical protein